MFYCVRRGSCPDIVSVAGHCWLGGVLRDIYTTRPSKIGHESPRPKKSLHCNPKSPRARKKLHKSRSFTRYLPCKKDIRNHSTQLPLHPGLLSGLAHYASSRLKFRAHCARTVALCRGHCSLLLCQWPKDVGHERKGLGSGNR